MFGTDVSLNGLTSLLSQTEKASISKGVVLEGLFTIKDETYILIKEWLEKMIYEKTQIHQCTSQQWFEKSNKIIKLSISNLTHEENIRTSPFEPFWKDIPLSKLLRIS